MSKGNIKKRYPDARVRGVMEFFDLVKSEPTWKPDPVTKETLMALGLAKSKAPGLLFAIRFMDIIDDDGRPTEEFDKLRQDFASTLSRLVKSSYDGLFETIPLSRMNQETLVNFFMAQGYAEDTAEYQARLFADLCEEAGIDLPNVEDTFKRARFEEEI